MSDIQIDSRCTGRTPIGTKQKQSFDFFFFPCKKIMYTGALNGLMMQLDLTFSRLRINAEHISTRIFLVQISGRKYKVYKKFNQHRIII